MKYTGVALTIIVAFTLSGCYEVGKDYYVGAKKVISENKELIPEEALEKLKKADGVAVSIDKARTEAKEKSNEIE